MLLEFRTKNFKSFKDEIIFRMTPTQKIKDLPYSVLSKSAGSKKYLALSSAVIYGPNATGKTNIISAMEVLKTIVLRGHIRNDNKINTPNVASAKLEVIPNTQNKTVEPVEFEIKFIDNEILFDYFLSIDLGVFLDAKFERKIVEERLSINEKMIYDRKDELKIGDIDSIKGYLVKEFTKEVSDKLAKNNLDSKELFLTSMFKMIYSSKIVNIISEWFEESLLTVYRADSLDLKYQNLDETEENNKKVIINDQINEIVKVFGLGGNKIGYSPCDENGERKMMSFIQINEEEVAGISAEMFESYGTVRFTNVLPILLDTLLNGKTLVIDEFDASIHPMALMSIINIFHNDEINTKGAQLIFNTHNPIFLNRDLFRRDEVKFVEKDEKTGISNHYSLADFGTSGPNGVRNTADYMKNYFINRYGAIKNIDFSDIFLKELK